MQRGGSPAGLDRRTSCGCISEHLRQFTKAFSPEVLSLPRDWWPRDQCLPDGLAQGAGTRAGDALSPARSFLSFRSPGFISATTSALPHAAALAEMNVS